MPGTFSVPERSRRSWPPPCRMGCRRVPRLTYSAPMPLGPYSLWPERLSMSTPSSATSMGSEPTACTASVWNAAPFSWAIRASSATGCTVPTTLLANMMEASRVSSRNACS